MSLLYVFLGMGRQAGDDTTVDFFHLVFSVLFGDGYMVVGG